MAPCHTRRSGRRALSLASIMRRAVLAAVGATSHELICHARETQCFAETAIASRVWSLATASTSYTSTPKLDSWRSGPRYSTSQAHAHAGTRQRELSRAMRGVFRAVHPDLFHGFPAEQAVNQKSFQLLQAYLDAAGVRLTGGRVHGASSHGDRGPVRLHFYVRTRDDDATVQRNSGEGLPGVEARVEDLGLTRLTVQLPAPIVGPEGDPVASTRRALLILAVACGAVPREAVGKTLGGADTFGAFAADYLGEVDTHAPIAEFARAAAEVARRQEAELVAQRDRIATMRGAFRTARGVLVSVTEVAREHPRRQAELLTVLAAAVDAVETRMGAGALRGQTIALGNGAGVDASGTVWLDVRQAGPETWADALCNVNWAEVALRKARLGRIRKLEDRAADALGLGVIVAPKSLTFTPAYHAALGALVDAVDAARRLGVDPVGGVDLSGLALTFTEEGEDRGGGMPEPCWVDEATGRMAAHVAVAATDLLAFLAARGRQAREAQSRHARDEDAAARAATFARTQLRLRRLVRDPRVTSLQFQQCCRRLVEHAGSLSVALEGQSVRVSVAHGLPTWESPYIDIAWDFSH